MTETNNKAGTCTDISTSSTVGLPLGWTTVQRRRTARMIQTNDNEDIRYTSDPNVTSKNKKQKVVDDNGNDTFDKPEQQQQRQKDEDADEEIISSAAAACRCCPDGTISLLNHLFTSSISTSGSQIHTKAIFCLHDYDPQWFQGYILFTESTSTKNNVFPMNTSINSTNWGLLCIQETIDDCLQCQDGGYRQLTISINTFSSKDYNKYQQINNTRTGIQKVSNVQWTGGDMIKLSYNNNNTGIINDNSKTNDEWTVQNLYFETDQLITGTASIPYVERYFTSLVRNLRSHYLSSKLDNEDVDVDPNDVKSPKIYDLIPNVAIVIGTISITMI